MTTDETKQAKSISSPRIPQPNARALLEAFYTVEVDTGGEAVPVRTLRCWRGDFFRWSGRHWAKVAEHEISDKIYRFTDGALYKTADGNSSPWPATKGNVASFIDALKAECRLADAVEPNSWLDSRAQAGRIIPCLNGLLERKASGAQGRVLHAHTPLFFNLAVLPFGYDAEATCPTWDEFQLSVWPGVDGDDGLLEAAAETSTLEEVMGCLAAGMTGFRRALVVVGPTTSGKGTIAGVIKALIGGNYASLELRSLSERFGLSNAIGRVAYIFDDVRSWGSDMQGVVEKLLKMGGRNDDTPVDRKNKEPWQGKLDGMPIMFSNEPMQLRDGNSALLRRYLLLDMPKKVADEDVISDLDERLQAELPGILNRTLDGLDRVIARGNKFVQPATSEALLQITADTMSPMKRFVDENIVFAAAGAIPETYNVPKKQLYTAYNTWCQQQGEPYLPFQAFILRLRSDLRDRGAELNDMQLTVAGKKGVRCFVGFRLDTGQGVPLRLQPVSKSGFDVVLGGKD